MDNQAASFPVTASAGPGSNQKPTHWHSFLDRIGHFGLEAIAKILPGIKIAAQEIEPEFDLLFPLEGPVFNSVVRAICTVQMASGAGTSGETKLQSVMGLVGASLRAIAASHNLPEDQVEPAIRQYLNGLVALLNSPTRNRTAPVTPAPVAKESGAPVPAPSSETAPAPEASSVVAIQADPEPGVVSDSAAHPSVAETVDSAAPAAQSQWPNSVIDLSHHNGVVDLAQAAGSGITAVIHKATQGNLFVDPAYDGNLQKALAAGLLWGAYHFGTGDAGEEQAKHFLQTVHPGPSTLMALDIEANPQGPSMTLEEARDFVLLVHQQTGRWPGVYGGYYLRQMLAAKSDPVLANCWLWLSQYDDKPTLPGNWKDWTLWQYTDGTFGIANQPVPGVGICDRSYFNGSADELASRWQRGTLG